MKFKDLLPLIINKKQVIKIDFAPIPQDTRKDYTLLDSIEVENIPKATIEKFSDYDVLIDDDINSLISGNELDKFCITIRLTSI